MATRKPSPTPSAPAQRAASSMAKLMNAKPLAPVSKGIGAVRTSKK